MKIVYYLPSLYSPGGLERVITFKANYFAENFDNYEVYIMTSEQMDQPLFYPLSPKVKHIDLNTPIDWPFNQSIYMKLLKYPFKYYIFRKRFKLALKKIKPDIVISTLRRELNFIHNLNDKSIKIAEFHVTKKAYGINCYTSKNNPLFLIKEAWNKRVDANIKKFNKLILLTKEEEAYWKEFKNTRVIPNPIITLPHSPSDCSQPKVIAVGRYDLQKGFDLLIESWKLVHKKHPKWILSIYGDGEMRDIMQHNIDESKLSDSCFLEPTTKNISDKYQESSIFVLSSRYEGFGMVITEAMASGVPPIAFACPCGPKDIITDNVNGLLAENGNITDLANKICYLIENENIRKVMGKNALLRSYEYRIEKIAEEWKQLFEECVRK